MIKARSVVPLLLAAGLLVACNPRTYKPLQGHVKTVKQYTHATDKADVTLKLNDSTNYMLHSCTWYNKHGHATMQAMYDWRANDTFTIITKYKPFKIIHSRYYGTGNNSTLFQTETITKLWPRKYKIKSYYPDGKISSSTIVVRDRNNRLAKKEEQYTRTIQQTGEQVAHTVTTVLSYSSPQTILTTDYYLSGGIPHTDTTLTKTHLYTQDSVGNPILQTQYQSESDSVTELYQYEYYK